MSQRAAREVMMVERESASPIWWLLVGGAVGAGLALLFAPQPGDRTRRSLSRKLAELRDSAGEMYDEFRAAASDPDPDDEPDDEEPLDDEDEDLDGDEIDEEVDDEDEDEDEEADDDVVVLTEAEGARAQLEKRLVAARARRQRALAEEDVEEPVA